MYCEHNTTCYDHATCLMSPTHSKIFGRFKAAAFGTEISLGSYAVWRAQGHSTWVYRVSQNWWSVTFMRGGGKRRGPHKKQWGCGQPTLPNLLGCVRYSGKYFSPCILHVLRLWNKYRVPQISYSLKSRTESLEAGPPETQKDLKAPSHSVCMCCGNGRCMYYDSDICIKARLRCAKPPKKTKSLKGLRARMRSSGMRIEILVQVPWPTKRILMHVLWS